MDLVIGLFGCLVVISFVGLAIAERRKVNAMSPGERREYLAEKQLLAEERAYGPTNPAMVCPHCANRGKVRTRLVTQKKGISGGKATAALMTAGVSMLATGLSRKEQHTGAFCGHCRNRWVF